MSASSEATESAITPSTQQEEGHAYHRKSPLTNAGYAAVQSAGVGLVAASVQNALAKHNAGALGIFTKFGGTIGVVTAMGTTFAFVDGLTANIRQKDDYVNGVVSGCSAGIIMGLKARSLPGAVGGCALLGSLVGTFDIAGGTLLSQYPSDLESREERRRKFFKKSSLPPTAVREE